MVTGTRLEQAEAAIVAKIQEAEHPITAKQLIEDLSQEGLSDEATLREAVWKLIDRMSIRLTDKRQLVMNG